MVDAVRFTFADGPGEFVLGVEVGHAIEVEETEAVAEARGDAVGVVGLRGAKRVRDLAEEERKVGLGERRGLR
jgi:hypothetical protein